MVFVTRMPAGIPGAVTRVEHATIEPQQMDTGTPVTAYGVPVKHVAGLVQPIAAADVVANVFTGFIMRPYPTQSLVNEALGVMTPLLDQPVDELVRGYMTVKCNMALSAKPAKDGIVYARKTDHGAGEYPIGGIESDADSAKNEAIPHTFFTGPADSDGNVEISVRIK
jgi:hypothetical protein